MADEAHAAAGAQRIRLAYTLLFRLLLPLMLFRLWWRGRKQPAYRSGWRQRFGFVSPPSAMASGPLLWVHAVSVGETQAAEALIRTLLAGNSALAVVITTTTPTGAAQVKKLFAADLAGDGCSGRLFHSYAPFDLPGSINRFINALRPVALLVMETEVWPNWLSMAESRSIPSFLINARMSERSAKGYQRIDRLARPAFRTFTYICAQSQADAERLLALGARPEAICVTGSIKFDQAISLDDVDLRQLVARAAQSSERFVWIAASTHDGEEQLMIETHGRLLQDQPDALLILVPRHPDRFERVDELLRRSPLTHIRRSELSSEVDAVPRTDALLVDSMGELLYFYEVSQLAFVGGSLVRNGGHNPLEPAALGKAVIMGESQFNFADICNQLSHAEGLITVDRDTLGQIVARFAHEPELARQAGDRGKAFVLSNRGAIGRVCERILPEIRPRIAQIRGS